MENNQPTPNPQPTDTSLPAQMNPTSRQPAPKKKLPMLVVIVFIVLLSGVTSLFAYQNYQLKQQIAQAQSTPAPTINVTQEGGYAVVDDRTLELLDSARRKVVKISSSGGGGGTGFFIRPNGYVVTNDHVVRSGGEEIDDSVKVTTFDGTTHSAIVIGANKFHDIAVLKIEKDYPHFEFASSSELEKGETVFAIGHPFSLGSWIITSGTYLSTEETRHIENVLTEFINTTDITRSGNSGGPVLNAEMKVVGVSEGSGVSPESEAPLGTQEEIKVIANIRKAEPELQSNAVSSDIASRLVDEMITK